MFRMYDTDKNGYLDQVEMDSIIDQMMTVAEYMGWETNELRPVGTFSLLTTSHTESFSDLVRHDGGDRLRQWRDGVPAGVDQGGPHHHPPPRPPGAGAGHRLPDKDKQTNFELN